jgi:transcriptional regulator GlxA family with amidase domain
MTKMKKQKLLNSKIKKKVVIIVFDGVEILDVSGPCSVFCKANLLSPDFYDIYVFSDNIHTVDTNSGVKIFSHGSWRTENEGDIDTLIIAGGDENKFSKTLQNKELSTWISLASASTRRVVSICTGIFSLGYAGLLEGRYVTTHWKACDLLQEMFPNTRVLKNKVYVRDGNIWSSAGILTGIDLALALVEDDLGKEVAFNISSLLMLPGIRFGNAPQLSALLMSQFNAKNPIRELISWIQFNFREDCSLKNLASRTDLSTRHLSRLFKDETGVSPSKYVLIIRLDYAALLLKNTNLSIINIVYNCGFENKGVMQRGFINRWGVTPKKYRENEKHDIE